MEKRGSDISLLKRLATVYENDSMDISLRVAIVETASLKQLVEEGKKEKSRVSTSELRDIQKFIEWLAHPRTGRDRLAIAIAHLRDFFKAPTTEIQIRELEGCLEQLVTLYNYMFEDEYVL